MIRDSLPACQLPIRFSGVYAEIVRYLAAVRVEPAGPPFARYAFHDNHADVEAGLPATGAVSGNGRLTPSSLPAGPAAVTAHDGHHENSFSPTTPSPTA